MLSSFHSTDADSALQPTESRVSHQNPVASTALSAVGVPSANRPWSENDPDLLTTAAMFYQLCADTWEVLEDDESDGEILRIQMPVLQDWRAQLPGYLPHSTFPVVTPSVTRPKRDALVSNFTPINDGVPDTNGSCPRLDTRVLPSGSRATYSQHCSTDSEVTDQYPKSNGSRKRAITSGDGLPKAPEPKRVADLAGRTLRMEPPRGGTLIFSVRQNNAIKKQLADKHEISQKSTTPLSLQCPHGEGNLERSVRS